jgi:hypothetical protein
VEFSFITDREFHYYAARDCVQCIFCVTIIKAGRVILIAESNTLIILQLNEFFIIYMPSQQLQSQLQTQHSVDTGNYIVEQYNIDSKRNYRQALEENT